MRNGRSCTRWRRALIWLGIIRGPVWNLNLILLAWLITSKDRMLTCQLWATAFGICLVI
ncbi:hypothetical protein Godav_029855 [Gossypium davidsonii]|uniref:Uncharacterized protein n=1 Tax=Gossypium davidsonii TaxID=34287 RepID=A0A7J8TEF9_GOSDV|nr:hypothetical protein [Gossypium davidsonii]